MVEKKNLRPQFRHREYLFRRKVFKFFGGAFHIYDEFGNLVFYSKQKPFKLKEDFRVYSDETQGEELLTIKTPQILDFGATYWVEDSLSGERVGALRRKAFKSLFKDEWVFLSPEGQEIGKLTEKSFLRALLTRFLGWVPQIYLVLSSKGTRVAEVKQHFNPLVLKYTLKIVEPEPSLDPRLLVACGILLAGIEKRER